MNAAIVLASVVLLIQGTRIVIRPGAPSYVRCFGVLTLLLAGLSLALFAILFWGEAVLSPEFDVVMARGHWRGLVALVIGFAVAAGLGLHVQRLKAALPRRLSGLLILGLAVGVAAATRVRTLNIEDTPQAFWIYSYDLWWPPLLVWVSACFLDGAITILGVHERRVRAGAFFTMLLLLSLRSQRQQVFPDPTSAMLWNLAFWAAAAGALILLLWLTWSASIRPADAWRGLRAAAQGFGPALRREVERALSGGWAGISWRVWRWLQPLVGQLLAVLALIMIAASLADIFYVGRLPHAGALIVLAMAWTGLAEVTAQGPLRAFVLNVVPEVYQRLANQESGIRQGWLLVRERLAGPVSRVGGALGRLVSLRPFPEALMKISVLLVGLVIAYEIPHAGKTLLQPFSAVAVKGKEGDVPTVSPQPEIGRAVFDHLVNTLGALTLELQPDVILMLPPEPDRGARFRTLASGGSGTIDPFLTQATEIELVGGVRLPLGLVLMPVLRPVRWGLGVRVVDGSVLADPQGYTVLARSSSGEMWRARLGNDEVPLELPGGEGGGARSAPDSAFSRIGLELAFRIMSAEPALAKFGMTRSWDAFSRFKRGLDSWQEFSLYRGQGDPDTLTAAIWHFRAATTVDPEFALAHYRLGVALQNDGQPLAAAESLRASLKANPGFVPAMVALASVLYGSEHDRESRGMGFASDPVTAGNPRLHEARQLWQSVISAKNGASSLDRAAAWAGLCRHALDEPEIRHGVRSAGGNGAENSDRDLVSYRTAYFYCQQAERLYAPLLATPREDLRLKTARASELASIGVLLERYGPRRQRRATDAWQCSTVTLDKPKVVFDARSVRHHVIENHYTRAALAYYRQALKLLPDDSVLRCHEASAEFAVSGNYRFMQSLESEAASRWNLAEGYRDEARRHLPEPLGSGELAATEPDKQLQRGRAAVYFELALAEYQATLERDPTSFDALNRYASVFLDWRRAEARGFVTTGPGLAHARRAEANARRAVAMMVGKQVKVAARGSATESADPGRSEKVTPIAQVGPAESASKPSPGGAGGDVRSEPVSMSRHLRPTAAAAYASLGAVLVAQSRPHEAIEALESAYRYAPEHPSFDHVRWLFAQAHLCAASREFRADFSRAAREKALEKDPSWRWEEDPRLESIGAHRDKARRALEMIRDHERSREAQPFAGLTDIGRAETICRDEEWLTAATRKEGSRLQYQLNHAEPATYRALCSWLGVRIESPADLREKERLFLRVWGGGVDERLEVESERRGRRPDPVSLVATPNRFYYFAQLETADGKPVSLPLVLTQPSASEGAVSTMTGPSTLSSVTVAAPSEGASSPGSGTRCPAKNLIQLTFARVDTPVAQITAQE
jgi:tetratricopeptide (TPR) repeat protein